MTELQRLLEDLLEWSDPRRVGARTTQVADATDEFWDLWREDKDELKALGIRVSRDDDSGEFTVAWIRKPSNDLIPERPPDREEKVVRFLRCPEAQAAALYYLYPDQRDALWTLQSAVDHMMKFTLDASEPGIGKTWVALALMVRMGTNFGIVCPANVVTKWTDTAISDPFNLEPEFVMSYDKLRTGTWDFVSRFTKGTKRKTTWFEWNVEAKVALIFDEVHKCAGEKSLNAALLKAAIDNPLVQVHAISATSADSPLDLKTTGYGLGLHDGKEFWRWCQRVGCKRGHFGGLTFSTGDGSKEPTLNQRRARTALNKIHGHIFPRRGVRITVGDSSLWRPKNQIFAELVDVDERDKRIQDALRRIDEKETADYDKADAREREISALTLNTRDRQRAEITMLPAMLERLTALRQANNSVVVFLNYTDSIDLLAEWFCESHPIFSMIVGGLSDKVRNSMIHNFQTNVARICVCQIDAGAESIDLDDQDGAFPRCSLISPGYDAKKLYQALGRPYRPASTKSLVRQWILFAVGTVQERVGRLVQAKLNGQALINDGDLRGAIDITPKK